MKRGRVLLSACIGLSAMGAGDAATLSLAEVPSKSRAAPASPVARLMTRTERVRFRVGGSGAHLSGSLSAGQSIRYLLRAKRGEVLSVAIVSGGPYLYFNIISPGGALLYESEKSMSVFRGRVLRSGDHVVEVYYSGQKSSRYRLTVGLY